MNIELTQGKYAIVDDEHAHIVSRWKWHYHSDGYAVRAMHTSITSTIAILMHRALWEVVNGPIPPGMQIDHINGDKLDDRLENLRLVNRRQQSINTRARREGKTSSIYPGVSWHSRRKKWQAQIQVNGRKICIGRFDSEEEANMAYQSTVDSLE